MWIYFILITIIGADNGLSPGRHQAIIWSNTSILLVGPWGTNFTEIFISKFIHLHSRKSIWVCRLEIRLAFCLSLNMFNVSALNIATYTFLFQWLQLASVVSRYSTAAILASPTLDIRLAHVDWVRERYGFISVDFCQRWTLLTLSVYHVRINAFPLLTVTAVKRRCLLFYTSLVYIKSRFVVYFLAI